MNLPYIDFSAQTDVVVIGQDHERADYDNPRGDIIAFGGYVIATFKDGSRVRKHVKTSVIDAEALGAAERMAFALNNRLNNLKKLPVAFNTWEETFPAYGSDAHDEQELIEWERRIDDDYEFYHY